jgi:transposase
MSPLPDQYPDQPGFKAPGPSEQAAQAICSTAKKLRDQVLKIIAEAPAGLSADAVADRLGKSVLSVRPRVSELRRLGEIQPTTQRVKNQSGMSATV